jgi:hypothetical protein
VETADVRSSAVAPLNTARGKGALTCRKPHRSYLCETTNKLWVLFLETGLPHVHNNVDFSSYRYTESRFYLEFLGVLPAVMQYVEMKQCASNQTVSGCQEILHEILPTYLSFCSHKSSFAFRAVLRRNMYNNGICCLSH